MADDTIRLNLVNMLNQISSLVVITPKGDFEDKLIKLQRIGFLLLEEVVKKSIDSTTQDFRTAIENLKTAQKDTQAAIKDISKIKQTIASIAAAINAVDKVVGVGLALLG